MNTETENKIPRLLLVDDDPAFGRIMIKFSERSSIPLTYCASPKDVERQILENYDMLLIDYDLKNITGLQFIQSLYKYVGDIPVVIISSYGRLVHNAWPASVIRFIPKANGPLGILTQAVETFREISKEEAL